MSASWECCAAFDAGARSFPQTRSHHTSPPTPVLLLGAAVPAQNVLHPSHESPQTRATGKGSDSCQQ